MFLNNVPASNNISKTVHILCKYTSLYSVYVILQLIVLRGVVMFYNV